MKSDRGMTKSDLMVVLICVVLALLNLGGLSSSGRERARRIVCAAIMARFAQANHIYADNWDEWFCPPMMIDQTMPDAPPPIDIDAYRKVNWLTNMDFRRYTGLDDRGDDSELTVMPKEYFCPADKVARSGTSSIYGILCSFAYNVTDWSDQLDAEYWPADKEEPGTDIWMAGHKRTAITRASEKINLTDSSDWWCTWYGADYEDGWDIVGHGSWVDYDSMGVYGPVLYRHKEGANFAFYDGHIEYLPKGVAYIETADSRPKDATEMWYVIEPNPWLAD